MKKQMLMMGTVVSLVFLPGCGVLDSFKGEPAQEQTVVPVTVEQEEVAKTPTLTGEVVATLDGKAIVTSDSLEAEKDNLIKSKPELKAMLGFMDPDMLNKNLTEGLISQEVVNHYIIDNDIDRSADYQRELADLIKNMRKILNVKFFSQQFSVSVSDDEVRKFYQENKTSIPDLIISQGGVTAQGVEFDSKEAAQSFMSQVKAAGNNINAAAQQQGLAGSVTEFKAINAQSMGIDKVVREKLVATKSIPSVELISSSTGTVWVVQVISKEEPKYIPLEQVSPNIKQLLENNKRNEKIESEIAKLRQRYNIVVNEDFFKSAGQERQREAADYEQEDQVALAEDIAAQRVA
jgi:hypothetical protein